MPAARRTLRVLVVTSALVAAACSSSSKRSEEATTLGTTPPTSATSTTSSTPGSTSASGATTTSSTPGGTSTTAASDRCTSGQLSVSVGFAQGAAGNIYVPVVLTNHGTTTCVIRGFPGVSLLDAAGNPIGSPATRDASQAVTSVTLAPGARASTIVHTLDQGIAPGGCRAASTSLRIYPPGQTASLTVPAHITVCGNTFSVTPMAAGDGTSGPPPVTNG
jgi:hypothetical protein